MRCNERTESIAIREIKSNGEVPTTGRSQVRRITAPSVQQLHAVRWAFAVQLQQLEAYQATTMSQQGANVSYHAHMPIVTSATSPAQHITLYQHISLT
jgi:hypothetical protein